MDPVHALKLFGPENTELLVEQDDWRLVYRFDGDRALYNISSDPEELIDRYEFEPNRVAGLWDLLMPRIELIEESRAYVPTNPGP